jgi:hypothetical protein
MHPLNPVLSRAVISEIENDRILDAAARAGESPRPSLRRTVRERRAARRGAGPVTGLGPRPTVRAGRA